MSSNSIALIHSFISENNLDEFLKKLSSSTISSIIKNISLPTISSSTTISSTTIPPTFENNISYIFTDGGCIVSKKKAAFSSVFYLKNQTNTPFILPPQNSSILKNLSFDNGSFSACITQPSTNNYAELFSIYFSLQIVSLNKNLFENNIIIYSDSMYSIKCITLWSKNWLKNSFKTASGKDVLNKDLIISILDLLKNIGNITFKHVFSHQTEPDDKSSFQHFLWNYNNIADNNIKKLLEL